MKYDGMYPTPKPHPVERHCPIPHPVAPTVERAPLLQVSSRTPPSLFQNAHIGPARGPHQSSPRPRSHNMLLEDFSFSGIPCIRLVLSLAIRVTSKYGRYHQFTLKLSAIYQWQHPTIDNLIHYIKKGSILQGTKTNTVHCLPFDFSALVSMYATH